MAAVSTLNNQHFKKSVKIKSKVPKKLENGSAHKDVASLLRLSENKLST